MIITRMLKTTFAAALLALSVSVAQAGSYTELVTFGDSLSDTGNFSTLLGGFVPAAPYAPGRFSNGPVWIDRMADNLGLSSLHWLGGGGNYAFGGATSSEPGSQLPGTSMLNQLGAYFNGTGNTANPDALYSIWIGGNDVLNADPDVDVIDDVVSLAMANVSFVINELAEANAMTFLVPNLPDIGLTPSSAGDPALAAYRSDLTAAFNSALAMTLGNLETSLDINIIAFDVAGLFAQLVADPGSFGFTNATDKCWTGDIFGPGTGTQCADPGSYVFWDDVHPTAAAHEILGDLMTQAVIPVPAALPLLLSGLGFLGFYGRRRAA